MPWRRRTGVTIDSLLRGSARVRSPWPGTDSLPAVAYEYLPGRGSTEERAFASSERPAKPHWLSEGARAPLSSTRLVAGDSFELEPPQPETASGSAPASTAMRNLTPG